MAEQFVNEISPALTLSTAITSTSSTTITPSSVAALPATGTFRIRIDNEYMKASVSGSDLTVTRGDGGSTPATHSSGTPVYVIVTKEALDAINTILSNGTEIANRRALNFIGPTVADDSVNKRVNITVPSPMIGAASGLPGSPAAGQIYVPTDGIITRIYDGTAWQAIFAPKLTIPPTLASWTTLNATGATFSDIPGGGIYMLSKIASGDNNQIVVRTVPSSGSWTRTVGLLTTTNNANYNRTGCCLYDSVSGKIIEFGSIVSTIGISRYNSFTGFNTDQKTSVPWSFAPAILWLRIRCDGTNNYFEHSPDGVNWWTLYSEAKGAFLTATHFGLDVNCNNGTWPSILTCISYIEA